MVTSCFALCCSERWYKGTTITFHRLPRNCNRAKKWLKALRRQDTDPSKWKNVVVCGKHFAPKCFKIDNRGKSLIPSAFPTLNLGLDKEDSFFKDNKGRKKTRLFHFADFSEEHIKKSPRQALRAFRLAKLIIQMKTKRIRELALGQMSLENRLLRCKSKIDRMPNSMRRKLGLTAIKENLDKSFGRNEQAVNSNPKKNTKTHKTGTSVDSEPVSDDPDEETESVHSDEPNSESKEPNSDSDEHNSESDEPNSDSDEHNSDSDEHNSDSDETELSDPDEKPSLPNSESDSSELMDEDEWAKTFEEDPEAPEEALGLPVQGGLMVEKTSPQNPIIKSVSEMPYPSSPILQNGPVPVMMSNGTSPISNCQLAAPLMVCPSSALPVIENVSYGRSIVGISKSTQTAIIDLIEESEEESTSDVDTESEPTAIAVVKSESTAIADSSTAVADSESESTAIADSSTAVADSESGSTVIADSSTAIADFENGSSVTQKVTKVSKKRQNYDSFGSFVAKRLNALGPKTARFLQTEFGTLLYKVERGEVTIR